MASDESQEEESGPLGIVGKSLWKENMFAGGFPGGEAFFKKWVEEGALGDIPDVPKAMQPSSDFVPKVLEKTGVLAALDKLEFFGDFLTDNEPDENEQTMKEEKGSKPKSKSKVEYRKASTLDDDMPPSEILTTDIPDEDLYSEYYPSSVRNLAPEIIIRSEGMSTDCVSISMTEVTASPTDLYYPKETKNKAPFIDIYYPGSEDKASVNLRMDVVEPLPTSKVEAEAMQPSAKAIIGPGGGLKLTFE